MTIFDLEKKRRDQAALQALLDKDEAQYCDRCDFLLLPGSTHVRCTNCHDGRRLPVFTPFAVQP